VAVANRKKGKSSVDSPTAPASPEGRPAVKRDSRAREEEIRVRAYELYLERGAENGSAVEDWLRAEREYRERSQTRSGHRPRQHGATQRNGRTSDASS